jgi:SAM-dependent methyltransferase
MRVSEGTLPPDRLAPNGRGVLLVACTDCGTLESVVPARAPDSVEPDGYLPHDVPQGIRGWFSARSQDRKAALITPWYTSGPVVDVGCGSGGFLVAWRRGRPHDRLLGLEPSPGAASAARERGLTILDSSVEEMVPEETRGAGLFTLWHVLEHLADPVGTLRGLREMLAPDGRIVIAVPNASAVERSLFGYRTIAWDPPRHRWHFTPEGLTAMIVAAELRVLDRFNLVSDDLYDSVGSLRWTLYPRAWVESGTLKERLATSVAVLGGVPLGLGLATLTPWRQRASLGLVLAKA